MNLLSKIKTPETKPFYLTSEFWLLIASGINTVVTGPQNKEALLLNGLAAAYALARGLAKSGSPAELASATEQGALATDLPQAGTTDIPPALPPADAAGVKGVQAAHVAAPTSQVEKVVQTGVTDLTALLAAGRELAAEHPEVIQQLKTEGVI